MASFEDVRDAEKKELQGIRDGAVSDARLRDKTAGLAFSGGGIRSATFHHCRNDDDRLCIRGLWNRCG